MAILQELLDQAWDEKETAEAVMAIRVAFQNLKNVANETKVTVDGVVTKASFANVHAELKSEGQICIGILDLLIATLAEHAEFIDFRPDQA